MLKPLPPTPEFGTAKSKSLALSQPAASRPLKTSQLDPSLVARVLASIESEEDPVVLAVAKRESRKFEGVISVGRASSCDLSLDLDGISRFHAYFTSDLHGREAFVKDGKSTNGTFVNGERLGPGEKLALADGDRVSFSAEYVYVFHTAAAFATLLSSS